MRRFCLSVGLLALGSSLAFTAPTPLDPAAPPWPPQRSPVQTFRELLVASESQREAYLARKSPPARALIAAKLREFETLSPAQRELRLRVAQLQFFLSPLLTRGLAERANLLATLPEEDRPMIEERLRAWDALPAAARLELLESQQSLSFFIRLETTDPKQLADVVAQAPVGARPEVETQLQRWLALSPEERARKTARFQRFFNLTEAEQTRTLQQLSATDRAQMAATLAAFEALPPAKRQHCVNAFRKFASLSPEQRAEFLQDAERWQSLSAAERAAWRRVVQRVIEQPPLPMDWDLSGRALLAQTNNPAR
jgi:hypothetical protein